MRNGVVGSLWARVGSRYVICKLTSGGNWSSGGHWGGNR
jgi:hypothetical protein